MTLEHTLFYIFSTIVITAASAVITSRNAARSVLSLVLAFVASSGLWLLLQAEFLAIVLIMVYVGAVMVLFLFVVMMLDLNISVIKEGFTRYFPIALLTAACVVAEIVYVINKQLGFTSNYEQHPVDYSNTEEVGMALYSNHLLPFELAAILLLVAMVAAVSLTFRGSKNRKVQDPGAQTRVDRKNRLKIVQMRSEE